MPFNARQVHCLRAMGLVPWVNRNVTDSATSNNSVQATELSSVVTDAQPSDSNALADWLLRQPLQVFSLRGRSVTCFGNSQASVLIITESEDSHTGDNPFAAADVELLDNILRSIGLLRKDINVCSIDSLEPEPECQAPGMQKVNEAWHAEHRIALFFTKNPVCIDAQYQHEFTSDQPTHSAHPLIGWRLPHPALLRSDPLLKRHAWNVLKIARKVLQQH